MKENLMGRITVALALVSCQTATAQPESGTSVASSTNEVLECKETTVVGVPKYAATVLTTDDGSLEVQIHDKSKTGSEVVAHIKSCIGSIEDKTLHCDDADSLVPSDKVRPIFSMSLASDQSDALYLQQRGLQEPELTVMFECAQSIAQ